MFSADRQQSGRYAFAWLVGSAAAATGLGLFLWSFLSDFVNALSVLGLGDADAQMRFQTLIAKFLIFSFFSGGFYQVLKNYKAQKHLQTLNQHRANCLRTFESFVAGEGDQKTKDAIRLQAARAIFEAGETGYVSNRGGISTAMETIRVLEKMASTD